MASNFLQDQEFIERLKAKDQKAFSQLVQHFHLKLRGFALSLSSELLAEDIMQDAWVAIWKGLPNFEGRSSLTTWIYTVVRNECSGRLRKEGRMPKLQSQAIEDKDIAFETWLEDTFAKDGHWLENAQVWSLNTPEAMLEETQLLDCIDHNLKALQTDQEAVFRLRELEQLSLDEICNILQISTSNVRVLLHRARHRLLKVVDHYQQTGEC